MNQKVFLIHGWSVQKTMTYQALHLKLAANGFDLENIFLGRYVSLDDQVEIRDIAKALHNAFIEKLGNRWEFPFHIITHSTGALIVRHWIVRHYHGKYTEKKPLKNVIFLAGPHFGSRLAHHGRSMLAHAAYLGDTGNQVLTALELGSLFSWNLADKWLEKENWKEKGIRPYNLIGDRVVKDLFKSKIFPAAYESGSDMVVRVAAGNLNFKRFELYAKTGRLKKIAEIKNIPFGALSEYTHSGDKYGIMSSIKRNSPLNKSNLRLILECLRVKNQAEYAILREILTDVTRVTREKRSAFAQIDFRFRDEENQPVEDYVFKLGVIVNGKEKPSKTVVHTHKNKVTPNHFTVLFNLKELEPHLEYFIELDSDSGSVLFKFKPDSFRAKVRANYIDQIICEDQTTQIDVVLSRETSRNLFVFHEGTDKDLHVKWNRQGEVVEKNLKIK